MTSLSNDELFVMLEKMQIKLNPGSDSNFQSELSTFQWNQILPEDDIDQFRNAVNNLMLEINPTRNLHEMIGLAKLRVQRPAEKCCPNCEGGRKRRMSEMNSAENEPFGSPRSKKVNAYEATNGVVKKTKKALETEGPKRPMSSLDVYIVKYCSTKDMDPKSFSRTAWRDAYNELKESKRIRHIRAAITDELRYQQEVKESQLDLSESFKPLTPFSQISKKELELFLQHEGIGKPINSAYSLLLTEKLQNYKGEDNSMTDRMRQVAAEWQKLPEAERKRYQDKCAKMTTERMQKLQSASEEVKAADKFLRKTTSSQNNKNAQKMATGSSNSSNSVHNRSSNIASKQNGPTGINVTDKKSGKTASKLSIVSESSTGLVPKTVNQNINNNDIESREKTISSSKGSRGKEVEISQDKIWKTKVSHGKSAQSSSESESEVVRNSPGKKNEAKARRRHVITYDDSRLVSKIQPPPDYYEYLARFENNDDDEYDENTLNTSERKNKSGSSPKKTKSVNEKNSDSDSSENDDNNNVPQLELKKKSPNTKSELGGLKKNDEKSSVKNQKKLKQESSDESESDEDANKNNDNEPKTQKQLSKQSKSQKLKSGSLKKMKQRSFLQENMRKNLDNSDDEIQQEQNSDCQVNKDNNEGDVDASNLSCSF